jgi:hypothetical protein
MYVKCRWTPLVCTHPRSHSLKRTISARLYDSDTPIMEPMVLTSRQFGYVEKGLSGPTPAVADLSLYSLLLFSQSALREDDMPAVVDLLPKASGDAADNDDDDDDIVAYGVDRQKFKCPLSLAIMTDPLKSTVCQHAFQKEAILAHLGNSTRPCPTGCNANLNKKTLVADPHFTRACLKYARREESRREKEKTQQHATMLD